MKQWQHVVGASLLIASQGFGTGTLLAEKHIRSLL